mgnify:FL=1
MSQEYWEMTYGDALKYELSNISSTLQRLYFLDIFKEMGQYVIENEADGLTFREYFDMFKR